ncbi:hypothetical protein BDF14DRAFT_1758471 [Spinellus fusiger]|nr:hypothetical protein BDF14DRAFT_1758471 [Spinellus fusiger]
MSTSRIYSAVYSGVPVFEMVVQGVAVMRRRADSYMNATQILKVAGIEKGKRTKILEREVLSGEHEKVQGGYGKYQGTWIPYIKGKQIAERYGVLPLLAPMFDFDASILNVDNEEEHLPTKEQAIALARKKAYMEARSSTNTTPSQATSSPPKRSSASYRSSTLASRHAHSLLHKSGTSAPQENSREYKRARLTSPTPTADITSLEDESASDRHRRILMAIFLSDNPNPIPELLSDTNDTANFNIDLVIDDQGHTALHWAAALARINTVELLVKKDADVSYQNYAGETPLMRAVMVTNSYDNDSFPLILSILKKSVKRVDQKGRTVLHHATLTAGAHARMNAALCYIHHLLSSLEDDAAIRTLIDTQDSMGDTALTIAARLECSEIVDMLIRAGANSKYENKIGLGIEDYQATEEPTTEEPTTVEPTHHKSHKSVIPTSLYAKRSYGPSQRGREIVSTVQRIVDALDEEYSGQLTERDQELQQAQSELDKVNQLLEATRKVLEEQQTQSQQLSETHQKIHDLKQALQTGWSSLETVLQHKENLQYPEAIDSFDEKEAIDALFDVPATETRDHKQLQREIHALKARTDAYKQNNKDIEATLHTLKTQANDKEMHCKRLIAACCNLPIDKIDELVKPLTLAIESDPPDLDLARVIGFMEKIKRQGAFPDYASNLAAGSNSAAYTETHNSNPRQKTVDV